MMQSTNSPIEAAQQLLGEFAAIGATPTLWLIDTFALEQIKEAAGASGGYLYPSTAPHATFMGLPYKSGDSYTGLELLTRDAAVAAGHITP